MRSCSLTIHINRVVSSGGHRVNPQSSGRTVCRVLSRPSRRRREIPRCLLSGCSYRGQYGRDFPIAPASSGIIHSATAAYGEYFNDYSGRGLVEDIYAAIIDEDALSAVEGLMAYAGLPTREQIIVTQRLEQAAAC